MAGFLFCEIVMFMISCHQISRRFGSHQALDGVSFEIPKGAIAALIGPNGAGKSTLLKILTGLLAASSGSAKVAGISVAGGATAIKTLIGVLPETLALFDALSIEEHLKLSGPVYGLSRQETAFRSGQLLEALALTGARTRMLGQCSYGMRKKTALAMALLHNPPVLFLDEPFEGVDPVTAKTIRDLLTAISQRGVTILLTSHILGLVEHIAERLMILRGGGLVWDSAVADLPQPVESIYFDLIETPPTASLEWLGSR